MRKNSLKIKEEIANKQTRGREIIALCKKEVREMTEDEEKEVNDLKREIKELKEELEECKKRAEELTFDEEDENRSGCKNKDNNNEEASEENEDEANEPKEENKRNMSKKKSFSLVRAIRSIANGTPMDPVDEAVIMEGRSQAQKRGFNVTGNITLPESRATVTVAGEGEDVVATDLFDIMPALRGKSVLGEAGAKIYSNLVNNIQIPKYGGATATWEGETSTVSDSTGAFSHITLSPKRLCVTTSISKQMLAQDSVDVENTIREDMTAAIIEKLEQTILGNTSGATQPTGIFKTIEPVSGVTGFTQICEVEANVEDNNINGEKVYIVNPKAKAALRGMSKGNKSTELVWENGEIDGVKAYVTTNLGKTGKKYVYGNFNYLAIGQWGPIDLTIDTVTGAKNGVVYLTINSFWDAGITRNEAFATATM